MKRFISSLTYTVVLVFLFIIASNYQMFLKEQYTRTFNMTPYIIFSIIYPIIFGMLINLTKLIREINKKGKWSIDWIKLIAVGIPLLYITLAPHLYFSSIGKHLLFLADIYRTGDGGIPLITISGVFFGYLLLDSIKKRN
ncbi:hypothetical protein [Virgibacillus sp. L01]|uniref:hypothetical protein n=1 Tax=Virgibacillus sp. L01 TaxID=3457429 RepID=UPI003FD09F04